MFKKITSTLTALALSAALAQPTATADSPADVASEWYKLSLELVQQNPSPPSVSRIFAYMGVTLYESVRPGMPGAKSLAGQLNGLSELPQPEAGQEYHWPTVANAALADISRKFYAKPDQYKVGMLEAALGERVRLRDFPTGLNPGLSLRSVRFGREVAGAIYEWSRHDGAHSGNGVIISASYQPPVGPGFWVGSTPLNPYWGNNRPFVLKSGDECADSTLPAYSEAQGSAFYQQALEVFQTSQRLSDEQRQIALFWSDDPGKTATPPGHWISILTQIVEDQRLSLDKAAEAYARLGVALADAFIGCWNLKYKYNLLRPISYVQQVLDQNWKPVLNTPPFPEYPSGHSVQSAGAAKVLTQLFGENFAFTDQTHTRRGLSSRSFKSFEHAAQEAAMSRLYGGIHFRAAIEDGLAQGRCIGERVVGLKFR